MSDQTLIILRICLLALVYLTFFRVLRAVWVELRVEAPRVALTPVAIGVGASAPVGLTPSAPAPTGLTSGGQLLVVAPPAIAGSVFSLSPETTIGRAAGCGVVIDDPRVSKLHVRFFRAADTWMVEDLGSTNGTILNGDVLEHAQPIIPGHRIQVGDVVMELS